MPEEPVSHRCAECFGDTDEPIFNVIGKVGPPDNPATFNLSFEQDGKPIGICSDCLDDFWMRNAPDSKKA